MVRWTEDGNADDDGRQVSKGVEAPLCCQGSSNAQPLSRHVPSRQSPSYSTFYTAKPTDRFGIEGNKLASRRLRRLYRVRRRMEALTMLIGGVDKPSFSDDPPWPITKTLLLPASSYTLPLHVMILLDGNGCTLCQCPVIRQAC